MRRRERLFKKAAKREMLWLKRFHRRATPSRYWRETWIERNHDGSLSICIGPSRDALPWTEAFMLTSRSTMWPPWVRRPRPTTLAEEVAQWQ